MLLLFFLISLLVLHIIGMQGLYYSLNFYDKILHFIGGITAGLISIEIFRKNNIKYSGTYLLMSVFIIGIGWELFEFFWDLFLVQKYNLPRMQFGAVDTLFDLVFDLVGCLVLIVFLNLKKRK